MARSYHTDPPGIRAARRSADPRGQRKDEAATVRRSRGVAAVLGRELAEAPAVVGGGSPPVRIRVTAARPGFVHPASRDDVREALAYFGPPATYGVRSVEMRHAVEPGTGGFVIATLMVPGRIVLFEQAPSPWTFRGRLSPESVECLRQAGAAVTVSRSRTVVEWPADTLRDFMLMDGLMHEIGHHLIQHHTGKRTVRVMRTHDHELRADAFARACRREWVRRAGAE